MKNLMKNSRTKGMFSRQIGCPIVKEIFEIMCFLVAQNQSVIARIRL
jgi:hypothetical protein